MSERWSANPRSPPEASVNTAFPIRHLLPVVLRKLQPDSGLPLIFCRQQLTNRRPSQVKSLMARAEELQRKLEEAGESNRIITQAVRLKQDELDQLSVINSAINRQLKVRRKDREGGGEDGRRRRRDAGKGLVVTTQ